MDSTELYHVKQQFVLGAYKSLTALSLPSPNSPDYIATLLYQARSHIALGNPTAAIELVPTDTENVALKALAALARYVNASQSSSDDAEKALEELRDLSVELEGDDVEAGTEKDKATARVLAATAFAKAGEIEEALETLGSECEDLEGISVLVQIYLSIHRPDLARKEYERAKNSRWAEDDLLLQLVESTIDLYGSATGPNKDRDPYTDSYSFYTEQLGNPSLSSPHVLTARGVTRILRGEFHEAKSDFEETIERYSQQGGEADGGEALAAMVVASALAGGKKGETETEELWTRLSQTHPSHPLVTDVKSKSDAFDEAVAKLEFTVPALPVVKV